MNTTQQQMSPRPLLVTGLSGFVGSTLKRMHSSLGAFPGWELLDNTKRYDLLSPESLDELLAGQVPSAVIHLAGQTFVPEAFRYPEKTIQVNLLGTLNLLQALKRVGFSGAFLYVSSGDVYGKIAEADLPVTEKQLPHPGNPYAVSKLAAEHLCYQWSCAEPWRIMIARPFNHIGAGQNANFVVPGVARQIIRIKHGLQPSVIDVGDIDVSRDFLDVRDVISAYFKILEHGQSGETYNVCSGNEVRVRDIINTMLAMAKADAELIQDPKKLRPSDQKRMKGSNQWLKAVTGWQPNIPLEHTLEAVLADWESREANG